MLFDGLGLNQIPPEPLLVAFAAVFGLLIGSFLNVCIYRLPRDLSIVRPRSQCPGCGALVRAWDNIPVLSYLLLRGKCRDCGNPISIRYPIVEISCAMLFAWFAWDQGITLLALRSCVLSALLLALIFTDLETLLLPEQLTVGGIVLGLIFAAFLPVGDGAAEVFGLPGRAASIGDSVLGALIPALPLWLTGWLYEKVRRRQGLGFGDVVMISEVGAFLGIRSAFLTLFLASVAGTIVGLIIIGVKKENAATYQLPLGSFLGAAGILVTAFGDAFMRVYVGRFP